MSRRIRGHDVGPTPSAQLRTTSGPVVHTPVLPVAVSVAPVEQLWAAYLAEPRRALRDRLVEHYTPLLRAVAHRLGSALPSYVEVADLVQCGVFGLIDAVERFDPARCPRFESYAVPRIRGAIIDELRAQDWVPRAIRARARELERAQERLENDLQRAVTEAELAHVLGMGRTELRSAMHQMYLVSMEALEERRAAYGTALGGVVDTLVDDADSDPAAVLELREQYGTLSRSAMELEERDRRVLRMYYFDRCTLAEIGEYLGVTESRACQLRVRAVERLRLRFDALSAA
jgi:RNA polymerase sigma factor FliA